ncbi:MAG: DNA polymerase [Turicibacter sp.]
MSILTLDSENTTWSKGSPFDQRNFNVCWSYKVNNEPAVCDFNTDRLKDLVRQATLLVGFNLKYDLHWLRKAGIDYSDKKLFCVQVAHFILNRQLTPYPSLENVSSEYFNEHKLDVVKTEYWDKGINTNEIPPEILCEYAKQDVELTYKAYLEQLKRIPEHQVQLIKTSMMDLEVLADIEWNGIGLDTERLKEKSQETKIRIEEIQQTFNIQHSVPKFNWSSNHHLSALLFGGEIKDVIKVPDGAFKTGIKKGLPKFKNQEVIYKLPRQYSPMHGTKRQGGYAVDEDHLVKLPKGDLIDGILEIKKLNKLNDTYYAGLLEKHTVTNQESGRIHANFNQCVTISGRLSSSNP